MKYHSSHRYSHLSTAYTRQHLIRYSLTSSLGLRRHITLALGLEDICSLTDVEQNTHEYRKVTKSSSVHHREQLVVQHPHIYMMGTRIGTRYTHALSFQI